MKKIIFGLSMLTLIGCSQKADMSAPAYDGYKLLVNNATFIDKNTKKEVKFKDGKFYTGDVMIDLKTTTIEIIQK